MTSDNLIYLVEDDEYVSRMYERAFRHEGHQVVLFHDGESALKELLAAKNLPAAIILDIVLPQLNGLDVLLKLRAQERFAKVPIIMLTNSFRKEDSKRFLSSGADLYLVKIENQSKEVVKKVETLLHQ